MKIAFVADTHLTTQTPRARKEIGFRQTALFRIWRRR
jgi:hypothetical protein